VTTKALVRLVATAGALLLIWLVVSRLPGNREGTSPEAAEWADFFQRLNRVTVSTVRLGGSEGDRVLTLTDGDWTINGLPTDSGTVARFWEAVESVSEPQLIARNPDNHARMGLVPDSASLVTFELEGDTRSLLVGNQGPTPNSVFVRLPESDAAYLLNANLRSHTSRALAEWRDRRVVVVDTAQVATVEIRSAGDSYTMSRGDSIWTTDGGAEVAELGVRGVLEELATLRANGILEEGDPLLEEPETASVIALSAPGDTLAAITLGGEGGERWVTARGSDTFFRLPSFRVDRVVPSRDRLAGG
jgi:hypothetical protein